MGISYRAGTDFHNVSTIEAAPERTSDAPCLDSSQAWFCRDLWLHKAREGVQEMDARNSPARRKRALDDDDEVKQGPAHRLPNDADPDANAGSDYDAMPDSDVPVEDPSPFTRLSIPNSLFRPARILVNPRCVTTYAGVVHTQLALDLFGSEDDDHGLGATGMYVLDDWEGAPESFVCQEQRWVGIVLWIMFRTHGVWIGKRVVGRPPRHNAGWPIPFMRICRDFFDTDGIGLDVFSFNWIIR